MFKFLAFVLPNQNLRNQTFNVGTGLTDKLRKNPPKVGSIITYRFQELTRDNVPRFVVNIQGDPAL